MERLVVVVVGAPFARQSEARRSEGATETVQPWEEAWTQGQAKEQGQNC